MKNNIQGAQGIPVKWTTISKFGIGKSFSAGSQVSFTTSHDILNEVYYPYEDNTCIRDVELLITRDGSFFSKEKRDTWHETQMPKTGIPEYRITNTSLNKTFNIEKQIITDLLRNKVLQKINFNTLK